MSGLTKKPSNAPLKGKVSEGPTGTKVELPKTDDVLKALENYINSAKKQSQKCKAVVCHACGRKDHDFDPHTYSLPCDHPWVLAPTGAYLIQGYDNIGSGGATLLDGKGKALTSQWATGLEKREGCSCM